VALCQHFQRYPGSLIGRFFGLHKINQTAFVVMENVFQTNIPIHRVYDLKVYFPPRRWCITTHTHTPPRARAAPGLIPPPTIRVPL
jgi:hypothetical protein